MSDLLNRCLDASHLITRAAGSRQRAAQALKMMQNDPHSVGWVRRYVIASAMLENTELELLKIKNEMGK